MSKFIIEFTRYNASALFEYHEDGYLIGFQLSPGTFTEKQFEFVMNKFPKHYGLLLKWQEMKAANPKDYARIIIKEVQPDLSFQAFYDAYGYKVSKRTKAENVWKRMDDLNKAKAIAYIPIYETHLLKTNVNKKYPETYLASDMWNN